MLIIWIQFQRTLDMFVSVSTCLCGKVSFWIFVINIDSFDKKENLVAELSELVSYIAAILVFIHQACIDHTTSPVRIVLWS